MSYKAIVFDLFGTLVDLFTFTEYHRVLDQMAEALEMPAEQMTQGWRTVAFDRSTGVLPTIAATVERICEIYDVNPSSEQVAKAVAFRDDFTRRCLVPRPDAQATLERLRELGFRIGLISDCSPEVPIIFQEMPIVPLFDALVFSATSGLKKPDPRIYQLVCTKLGVEPAECLYVGDGDSRELTGASKVGMHPICIRVPHENPEDAFRQQPDPGEWPRIKSLSDVLAFVS